MSFPMSKLMGLPLPYFTVCLSLSFGLFTAKGVNVTSFKGTKEFAGGILSYASFVLFFNHKLNHSAVVESREVKDEEECIAACTEKDICRSVNFKTTRDENGKYSCQILNTDKFISHNLYVASLDFHHYSFTGPCEHNPCNNGGTCYPCSDQKDFKCKCPPSLQGRTCDEAPYGDCVELLNAGIRNTGVHTIVDKNWEVPVYCDQDYMGGGWTMVFKVPSRNPLNIYNVWTKQESHNVAAVEIIDVASSSRKYYKNRWIKNWEQKKTQEVRLALYENESEVLSLVFNATDNDNENWFSKNRLLRSPWTDLHSELQNFFSLAGDLPNERVFYINKVNGNCTGDVGWLMVSAGKLCDYESRLSSKWAFMYSKLGTRVNWNEYENVGVADILVVFVR